MKPLMILVTALIAVSTTQLFSARDATAAPTPACDPALQTCPDTIGEPFPPGRWLDPSTGAIYHVFPSGLSACWIQWPQYVALGQPSYQTLRNPQAFVQRFGNRICDNADLGLWTKGFYQMNDGAIMYLRGVEACWVTWSQWVALGQPASQLSWVGDSTDVFRSAFYNGRFCTDAEILFQPPVSFECDTLECECVGSSDCNDLARTGLCVSNKDGRVPMICTLEARPTCRCTRR
jgi:hypothetical protein